MSNELTRKEKEIVMGAGELFNKFTELIGTSEQERHEFSHAIHAVQAQVLIRPAMREINGMETPID